MKSEVWCLFKTCDYNTGQTKYISSAEQSGVHATLNITSRQLNVTLCQKCDDMKTAECRNVTNTLL